LYYEVLIFVSVKEYLKSESLNQKTKDRENISGEKEPESISGNEGNKTITPTNPMTAHTTEIHNVMASGCVSPIILLLF
jgi:hypothetical protein